VFRFLRAKYPAAPDSEALTQQFFLSLLTGNALAQADQARGRFRDFLKKILSRFAYDKIVRAPQQAQFESRFVSIHVLMDDDDRAYEPTDRQTPEEAFDVAWKSALLQTVRRNLEGHYAAALDAEERRRFAIFAAL